LNYDEYLTVSDDVIRLRPESGFIVSNTVIADILSCFNFD
jgi:hypothetical protein